MGVLKATGVPPVLERERVVSAAMSWLGVYVGRGCCDATGSGGRWKDAGSMATVCVGVAGRDSKVVTGAAGVGVGVAVAGAGVVVGVGVLCVVPVGMERGVLKEILLPPMETLRVRAIAIATARVSHPSLPESRKTPRMACTVLPTGSV
jgi:hypothetical protein